MTMTDLKTEVEWEECDGERVAGSGKSTRGLYSIRAQLRTKIGVYQLEKSLYNGNWWYFMFSGVNGERETSGL